MEHAQPPQQETIATLVASLGITDDMNVDVPPAWVTQSLTPEQRAAFCRLVLHSAGQGLGRLDTMAILLFKLSLQPGLPAQAAGFLVFSAAEAFAGHAIEQRRRGLGAVNLAGVTGLVADTIARLDEAAEPEAEEVSQPAGLVQ